MKNMVLIAFGLLLTGLFSACSENLTDLPDENFIESRSGDNKHISVNDLPNGVLEIIAERYPDANILCVEYDREDREYEVYLDNNLELKFSESGVLVDIDFSNDDKHLSVDDLPGGVLDYITTNYPDIEILCIEKKPLGFIEVYLGNGLELKFNGNGQLVDIDDNNNDDNDGDGVHIDPNSLPQSILDYIATHYPNAIITEAERYPNKYEVELSNGLKLEFTLDGSFIEISGGSRDDNDDNEEEGDIDPDDLPQVILDYIATHYPNTTIVEAERDSDKYEVELSNDLELEFTLDGRLIKISGG